MGLDGGDGGYGDRPQNNTSRHFSKTGGRYKEKRNAENLFSTCTGHKLALWNDNAKRLLISNEQNIHIDIIPTLLSTV